MLCRTPIKVRYGETDMMGVVYHANYLLYFEDARIDLLEKNNMPYQLIEEHGYMCPIYSCDLVFHAPLRYGEGAFVTTELEECRPTKFTYRQRLYRDGMDPLTDTPLVEGRLVACTVDMETFKPVSLKRVYPDYYELCVQLNQRCLADREAGLAPN